MVDQRWRLVVLGSSVTALGVARNAYRLGLQTVLVDRQAGIACASRCASSSLVEGKSEAEILEHVCQLGQSGISSYLIATGDLWVRFVARHRAELDMAYPQVLHAQEPVLHRCLNKLAFAHWCRQLGIPTPTACLGTDTIARQSLRRPWILRPEETLHDAPELGLPKAIEIASEAELDHWLQRYAEANIVPILTESILTEPVDQFSIPFVRHQGETLCYVARKLRPTARTCRVGTFFESCHAPAIESLARRVIEQLGLTGMGEVEILRQLQSGREFVIEVNPRPWTQYSLTRALGLDFLGMLIGKVGVPSRLSAKRTCWIDFSNDLYAVFSRKEGMLRQGQLTFWQYLRSLSRCRAFGKLSLSDPWPFVSDLFHTLFRRGCRHGVQS